MLSTTHLHIIQSCPVKQVTVDVSLPRKAVSSPLALYLRNLDPFEGRIALSSDPLQSERQHGLSDVEV